ncbi:MAG: alpha/beta hydrolase [Deltaproteobacteria bacterium]|nr:alpha/beta hydrolase [Deltaproteobacteria bacterium]|tara:strand:- start:4064 stop:4831 length:768 start_codon:yes stop_codon:yes gene_type:complete
MKRKILENMIYFLLIYFIACAVLYFLQRKLIYFPTAKISHGLNQLKLVNNNESIDVIVLNEGKNEALIYFGGNAESVIYNAEDFLKEFPQHTVYLLNYRGYGESTGNPTEKGIFSDALFLFDKVKNKHQKISVIGRSLGTGVAVYLASRRSINKIALITPYDSIKSLGQSKFIIFPVFLLLKDKYDSLSRVKHIQAQTIALVAENDEIIPKKHSLRLINEFPPEQITAITIKNSGHNDISYKEEYYQHLKDFLNY